MAAVAAVPALYRPLVFLMEMAALALLLLYLEQSQLMLVVVALETINTAQVVLESEVLEAAVLVGQEHPQERLELQIQVAAVAQGVLTGVTALVLLEAPV